MDKNEKREIEEQIRSLPKGSITIKRINGKEYEYWQFRENGKQKSRRVKGDELEILRSQISERKRLENLLKDSEITAIEATRSSVTQIETLHFQELIRFDEDLQRFVNPVQSFKKREIYQQLYDYIYGPYNDRVFILYRLRRTGKTTMIRQIILDLSADMRKKAAFIQVRPNESIRDFQ